MRKSSPIDPLINKTTQDLLAATVLRPERSWYLSDLARHLRRRPSSLQEPLAALVAAGVLSRRKEGNRVYFQANPDCPFLPELQGLMAKTVGLYPRFSNRQTSNTRTSRSPANTSKVTPRGGTSRIRRP
jgi:hypothetical protein